ncbi:chloramphenicol-sensitive protein RarD [Cohaesibacter marisflavi]|uniref:Chloramphenicol-sensitive protein RarD n=2 Tax=Cohaesibacter marisflavi TaxID=655353 RepID=A0A1I5FZI6_9HYPH|nr:EamA family transporter RarD [Cohaesibacter marisflavi]SFO28681.1 chloramphenicol-sensitive protein RarD [Cohaesibacter marisflavi]
MSQMRDKAGGIAPASDGTLSSETASKDTQIGLLMALGAYGSWGIFPLYFSMLAHVPAIEVVAHRISWSLVLMAVWFLLRRRWGEVWPVLRQPRVFGLLIATGLLVSSNWLTYVWAVGHGQATEASLGYFIVPMVNVATGYLLLSERLSRLQIVAICLAILSILLQMLLLGTVPIVSLLLALTFGAYGYLRKILPVGANLGLLVELIAITPIAFGYILYLQTSGAGHFVLSDKPTMLLLIFTGLITSMPLIWFSGAAKRLNMITIGIMQYLNPSIQFMIAIFVLKESISMSKLATFMLIWLSVAVYSYDALSKRRHNRAKSKAV